MGWQKSADGILGLLDQAEGKALARRTGIAYEACMSDKKATIFKVRYLTGRHVRICGGHKREGGRALPGEASRDAVSATTVMRRRDVP